MTSADRDAKQFSADDDSTLSGFEPTPEQLAEIENEDEVDGDQESEIAKLREEAALNLDRYQRAVADLANYRRRKDQEILRVGTQTKRMILRQFLPVIDDFQRALGTANGEQEAGGWIDGFRLIERKLWSVLEAEGVRPMEAIGQPFDPSVHEAVEVDSEAQHPDTVVGEHQRGYFLGDEVLRPAMVKVGSDEPKAQ